MCLTCRVSRYIIFAVVFRLELILYRNGGFNVLVAAQPRIRKTHIPEKTCLKVLHVLGGLKSALSGGLQILSEVSTPA